MKQNIRNVIMAFTLVAVTAYGGAALYKKQSTEQTLLARKIQATELKNQEKIQTILAERDKKKATEALAVQLAEAKRQREIQAAAEAEKVAEADAIAAAKDAEARQAAIDAAAAAEAKRQADLLAAQEAAKALAAQQAVEAERIAAQKAVALAVAEAAAQQNSRRSRAS